ncbi:pyruvate ferredoxin oxidoreductase alpha subunit [Succinivibrio dextrinosolvens]|uniref:pyruvate ferredoxin oxidoreductase n=1 Tax=Succinivibrio dextrinosolvens TaxID=83771 RepID=UPI0008EC37DD|nr:pyruvate ferredoxin oxidoreductase [Succinivibrio dextrinosolvens]SFS43061.1 pyruvate ferredoxin oxidoreductase alpha subunit [Succinivibrio dextrinosolvens]
MTKEFLSGNEAFAYGVKLSKPHVISAYPITPQTTVVEKLATLVESGELKADFIHVESEHSALSAAIGASAVGARTFTATSSQGLLYMAECLPYAAGGRFPIVMMNANRSTALPWNIYGDQRDSLTLLDSGWIQSYAKDAQEALDLALMSFYIAEDKRVATPVMVNLDGFTLTHTYEAVEVPSDKEAEGFLPDYETDNKLSLEEPKNMAFTAGPDTNTEFKYKEHLGVLAARDVITECERRFKQFFKRQYSGLVEQYRTEDAEYVIITLGTLYKSVCECVDKLRDEGRKVGCLRLRYLRPFPHEELISALKGTRAIGVLEKDISFGNEGTVYTNVCSALQHQGIANPCSNYIAGLGGRDVPLTDIEEIFSDLEHEQSGVRFVGLEE